jgi:hypothetical protein
MRRTGWGFDCNMVQYWILDACNHFNKLTNCVILKSITDMENHWERLHHLLSDTQNKVDLNIETKKLYNELNMLKDLILSLIYQQYEPQRNDILDIAPVV